MTWRFVFMNKRGPKNDKDISGVRFGRLTALELVYKKPRYWWKCICDCGNEKLVTLNFLENGTVKSCGCYRKEFKNKIVIGSKYGRWTTLYKTDKRSPSGLVYWMCECECGERREVTSQTLDNGQSKSCGCFNRDKLTERLMTKREKRLVSRIGDKINEFTVVKKVEDNPGYKTVFLCKCSCGEEIELTESQIYIDKRQSCGHKRIGKYHWNYNHELSDDERKGDRYTYLPRMKKWAKEVYRRDGWRCVICNHKDTGRKGEGIVAHHLNSYRGHEDESTDLNNGATLCEHHHKLFHSTYGYGNNTKQQFEEFKNNRKVNNH